MEEVRGGGEFDLCLNGVGNLNRKCQASNIYFCPVLNTRV